MSIEITFDKGESRTCKIRGGNVNIYRDLSGMYEIEYKSDIYMCAMGNKLIFTKYQLRSVSVCTIAVYDGAKCNGIIQYTDKDIDDEISSDEFPIKP